MNIRNVMTVLFLATVPALLLQACGGILTSENAAKQYYMLQPLETPAQRADAGQQHALSVNVTAVPGLDTDRIMALGADARLNRYSNARWPDHLPEVLTSVLRRSLEASGSYDTRGPTGHGAESWRLQLEARKFYGLQDAAGESRSVAVELAGSLNCGTAAHPVRLAASSGVGEQRLSVVVAAHQAALDSITRELLMLIGDHCDH
jgi:ABC-type uncharacterized transport system auxiliary subunit